jgi:hypothetical protein
MPEEQSASMARQGGLLLPCSGVADDPAPQASPGTRAYLNQASGPWCISGSRAYIAPTSAVIACGRPQVLSLQRADWSGSAGTRTASDLCPKGVSLPSLLVNPRTERAALRGMAQGLRALIFRRNRGEFAASRFSAGLRDKLEKRQWICVGAKYLIASLSCCVAMSQRRARAARRRIRHTDASSVGSLESTQPWKAAIEAIPYFRFALDVRLFIRMQGILLLHRCRQVFRLHGAG